MRKFFIFLTFFTVFLLASCTREVIGNKFWEEEGTGFTSYEWMVDSGFGIGSYDKYTLFVQNNGKTTLFIAHFDDVLKSNKAERVDEKNDVTVKKIERNNGKVVSITVDNITYK